MTATTAPHLVDAIAAVSSRHRFARKLIVAPTFGAGRELVRRLSLQDGGWVGFDISTIRPLALRLARAGLDSSSLRPIDAFENQALLDDALDRAVAAEGRGLGELSEGVGFRERVHGAITALRMAEVGPERLDSVRLADWSKRLFLLRMLQQYERLLDKQHLADTALVLKLALAALEEEGNQFPPALGADVVLLVPGMTTRGLKGRMLAALQARGAVVLETDPVIGLETPDALLWNRHGEPGGFSYLYAPGNRPADVAVCEIDMFRAASVTDELREVIRRVAERGLRLDEVEIVTPDPATYGSAMHALSTRLGIPVTYAVGLPVERTRPGRVVRAYLDWIEQGFQANPIRRLLEAGDLQPKRPRDAPAPAELARRFRTLRIGWGRKRYRTQIKAALASAERASPGKWETGEVFRHRQERTLAELEALKSILFPALKATPKVPDRMGEGGAPVSPAELARGLRAFLRRVPASDGPDRTARDRIGQVLERVEATLRRRTNFRAAVTILRRHLEIRIRAHTPGATPDDPGAPWSSEGGHLHLSDLEHGGFTGRPAIFIVGADADHLPGAPAQDPVLMDGDRRVLGAGLPTSTELLRERVFTFAALLARLRSSHLTMSYAAWDATEARAVSPAPMLLQALRLSRRDTHLTFQDLHEALGAVVCRVPPEGRALLDRDDIWLSNLGSGDVMLRGVDQVRAAYPGLDAGIGMRIERTSGQPGPAHGVITARPSELDPRRNPALVMSASRLEDLGACPLRYLHSTVLRLYPPDDPELDPERWLDPRRRGGLLHEVFERTLREGRERGIQPDGVPFEELAIETLGSAVSRLKREVPVPGEGALLREVAGLEDDVRSFVRMIRQRGAPWQALEMRFGIGDDEPIPLEVTGGTVRLRGAIDRVDDRGIEGMRVVDYKTGRAWGFDKGTGVFNGGRRLQHAVYAHAAEARLGGMAAAGEYHYPTRRGENQAFVFDRLGLAAIGELLGHMFDSVAEGSFVPTDQENDCKFCDFADVCRARNKDYGKVSSPLALWSEEHLNTGVQPAFAPLKRVRTFED